MATRTPGESQCSSPDAEPLYSARRVYNHSMSPLFYIGLLALMLFLAILNAILPLPGFNFFVPLFSTFMTTQEAITFITVYFLVNSLTIVLVFRAHVRTDMVKRLLPASVVGAIIGSFLGGKLNELALTILVLGFVLFFFAKKLRAAAPQSKPAGKAHDNKSAWVVGAIAGFLQGGGLGGGDVRNTYLYAKELTIQEIRATTASVGASIFTFSLITRALSGAFKVGHLWLYMCVIPIALTSAYLGLHISAKMNTKLQRRIVLGLMSVSVILLIHKIVGLL